MEKHVSAMSIAIAGECMVTRPFSSGKEPGFTQVWNWLREADCTYAHLETNLGVLSEVGAPARGDKLGSYFLCDPQIAHDLRWGGVDICSLAQNHSYDFGELGIAATIRRCEEAGLAHAGTGLNLEVAGAPTYLETAKGRVSLVSAATGNTSNEWATAPKGGFPGRAGVNPLRAFMKCKVDQTGADALRAVGRELGILEERSERTVGHGGALRFSSDGEFGWRVPRGEQATALASLFQESDGYAITSELHPDDLARNLRAVEEARTMSDVVIVAHHCSVAEGSRGDEPPQLMRDFAHACIDNGADIYVGHGWHKTLGIEIYKGKPILYGLGDFFAQSEFLSSVPYDAYENWGHDTERLPTLTPAADPLHPGMEAGKETWWSSAVIDLQIEKGEVRSLRLRPVECGRDVDSGAVLRRPVGGDPSRLLTDGRPFRAEGANGDAVLDRYRQLSAKFGTSVEVSGGIGRIEI